MSFSPLPSASLGAFMTFQLFSRKIAGLAWAQPKWNSLQTRLHFHIGCVWCILVVASQAISTVGWLVSGNFFAQAKLLHIIGDFPSFAPLEWIYAESLESMREVLLP